MRARKSRLFCASLGALGLLACERSGPGREPEGSGPSEPSPNAGILPSPLPSVPNRAPGDKGGSGGGAGVAPTPLPNDRALPEDVELTAPSAGVEFIVDFSLPEVRRGVELRDQAERAHAQLLVQILAGDPLSGRAARQRVVLRGALFNLPEGTELRSRADRLGSIVVWPDGRSYRVVPAGATGLLLEERRVDVMPSFALEQKAAEEIEREGKKALRRVFVTPLGELSLTSEQQVELGEPSQLFCQFLVEFLRASRTEAACAAGELPLELRFGWQEGGELRGLVSATKKRSDLQPQQFAVPPVMSIFKPGELPPDSERPWSDESVRAMAFSGTGPTTVFRNGWDVPALLLIDGLPVVRLEPEQEWQFSPLRPGLRYQVRDFFGQIVRPPATLVAPGFYRLGADPEQRPDAASLSEPSSP